MHTILHKALDHAVHDQLVARNVAQDQTAELAVTTYSGACGSPADFEHVSDRPDATRGRSARAVASVAITDGYVWQPVQRDQSRGRGRDLEIRGAGALATSGLRLTSSYHPRTPNNLGR